MKTISHNAMDKAQEYYNVKGAANTTDESVSNATNRIRITTIAGNTVKESVTTATERAKTIANDVAERSQDIFDAKSMNNICFVCFRFCFFFYLALYFV